MLTFFWTIVFGRLFGRLEKKIGRLFGRLFGRPEFPPPKIGRLFWQNFWTIFRTIFSDVIWNFDSPRWFVRNWIWGAQLQSYFLRLFSLVCNKGVKTRGNKANRNKASTNTKQCKTQIRSKIIMKVSMSRIENNKKKVKRIQPTKYWPWRNLSKRLLFCRRAKNNENISQNRGVLQISLGYNGSKKLDWFLSGSSRYMSFWFNRVCGSSASVVSELF